MHQNTITKGKFTFSGSYTALPIPRCTPNRATPYDRQGDSSFQMPTISAKFKPCHPLRVSQIEVEEVQIGDFRPPFAIA